MTPASAVPRVLLVEDYRDFADAVRELLRDSCILVWTNNVRDAEALIHGGSDFAAIVVDANLGRGVDEVLAFVRRIKLVFRKPFVACSADPDNVQLLLTAGCTHGTDRKHELPKLLTKVLHLSN